MNLLHRYRTCAAAAADVVDASLKDVIKRMQEVEAVAERAKEVRALWHQVGQCCDAEKRYH